MMTKRMNIVSVGEGSHDLVCSVLLMSETSGSVICISSSHSTLLSFWNHMRAGRTTSLGGFDEDFKEEFIPTGM